MSTHAPESRPESQEDRPEIQQDGHAEVVEAKLVRPVEVSDESALSPPPNVYSVEISVPKGPPPPPPPVAPQPSAPALASQLQSEKVVIAAPLSFAGSAARIWKLVRLERRYMGTCAAWHRGSCPDRDCVGRCTRVVRVLGHLASSISAHQAGVAQAQA